MSTEQSPLVLVEVADETSALADNALSLIARSFPPQHRQSREQLRSELAEKRLGLLTLTDYHLLVAHAEEERVLGAIAGVYLGGVNAGLVTYLAVEPEARGGGTGERLRDALIDAFQADARDAGQQELAWVLGEVRSDNPWLEHLVRTSDVITFDFQYYHPGIGPGDRSHTLYRQPIADHRSELPTDLVRKILYAIYRRGYRVRYPLEHPSFQLMLTALDDLTTDV